VFSDEEIRRLFHAIDTQSLSEMSNRALVDPVLFRVLYAPAATLRSAQPATARLRSGPRHARGARQQEPREPHRARHGRLAAAWRLHRGRAPQPELPTICSTPAIRPHGRQVHDLQPVPRYLADATSHFAPAAAHPFAASRLRRPEPAPLGSRRTTGADAALPVRIHGPRDLREPVLPPPDRGRVPTARRHLPSQVRLRHPGPGRPESAKQ